MELGQIDPINWTITYRWINKLAYIIIETHYITNEHSLQRQIYKSFFKLTNLFLNLQLAMSKLQVADPSSLRLFSRLAQDAITVILKTMKTWQVEKHWLLKWSHGVKKFKEGLC